MSFECAVARDGQHCDNKQQGDTVYLGFLTFCATHQDAFEEVVTGGVLRDEMQTARYRRSDLFKILDEARRNPPPAPEPMRRDRRTEATVYFLRCDGFVKIGYSIDPHMRLRQIRSMDGTLFPGGIDCAATELLATEHGGFDRERELHKQFKHLRHTGEWFTEAPELTEYINTLQAAA